MNFIDLFAGAGGLSEGFINSDFNPIAHVEFDKAACFTLKTRAAFHFLNDTDQLDVYHSYLKKEITREELYETIPDDILDSVINARIGADNKIIFKKIDEQLNGEQVDLIIGGPPCQAYSYIGRIALKNKIKTDERNFLYKDYGKFLSKYKPKVFVFENVPGLLTAGEGQYYKNLKKYFRKIGYQVEEKLVNARNFNVIQRRERLIIIGWKKELNFTYPEFETTIPAFYRDDIFSDLPSIKRGDKSPLHFYSQPTNDYLLQTGIRNGVDFVTLHNSRPHNKRDLKIYRRAINDLVKGIRMKNNEIPESERTQKNIKDFLDRFKVVADEPHTMIAHIAKDGHHFIHPVLKQLRSISVREAARIQSFADDFYFEGMKENQNRTAAFKQIGNAVPPLLSNSIADGIKSLLWRN